VLLQLQQLESRCSRLDMEQQLGVQRSGMQQDAAPSWLHQWLLIIHGAGHGCSSGYSPQHALQVSGTAAAWWQLCCR
jgi:hypothetical protein